MKNNNNAGELTQKCKLEECNNTFIRGIRRSFCSKECHKIDKSKYQREYMKAYRATPEYAEKHRARMISFDLDRLYKRKARSFANRTLPNVDGKEMHHWSYKKENRGSVIYICPIAHRRLHALLKFNGRSRCYSVKSTGELLDTLQKHVDFINSSAL